LYKINEMGGACSTYGGEEKCMQNFVGKPEVKMPFGRSRSRWEGIIKMDLQEVGCGAWTGLIWIKIRTGDGHL
jgi:hypothetical protein